MSFEYGKFMVKCLYWKHFKNLDVPKCLTGSVPDQQITSEWISECHALCHCIWCIQFDWNVWDPKRKFQSELLISRYSTPISKSNMVASLALEPLTCASSIFSLLNSWLLLMTKIKKKTGSYYCCTCPGLKPSFSSNSTGQHNMNTNQN